MDRRGAVDELEDDEDELEADFEVPDEVVEAFGNRLWRLENLYWIRDEYGTVMRFKLRPSQRRLLDDLHYLNIILKARQEGFSTLIILLALDCCLFNDHFAAGLIADTKKNAENLLERAKFSYESLPDEILRAVPLLKDNSTDMEFANGSSIEVGVSLRSSTKNFLHVSEYGKICAKTPDKAEEVKSGSLNTLAPRQLAFIESTAEGKGGDFFDKVQQSRKITDAGRAPLDMEWKLHFFSWWMDAKYATDQRVTLTAEEIEYFEKLELEHGIKLTPQQEWWYALKSREQTDTMTREYPSYIDEAFQGVRDGAIFGKQMRALRVLKRIGSFPYVPGLPVNTFWDFGLGGMQTIWLHQEVAGRNRFVGYYENNHEGLGHYFAWLDKWQVLRDAVFGKHYGPHDVEHQRQGIVAKSIKQMALEVGFKFKPVQRNPNKGAQILHAQAVLPGCEFDEGPCAVGVDHLEQYSWVWDDRNAVWTGTPRKDGHDHGADGFMTFTDGYAPPKPKKVDETPPPKGGFFSR